MLSRFDHASLKTQRGPALTVLLLVVSTHSMPTRTVGGDIEQEREREGNTLQTQDRPGRNLHQSNATDCPCDSVTGSACRAGGLPAAANGATTADPELHEAHVCLSVCKSCRLQGRTKHRASSVGLCAVLVVCCWLSPVSLTWLGRKLGVGFTRPVSRTGSPQNETLTWGRRYTIASLVQRVMIGSVLCGMELGE